MNNRSRWLVGEMGPNIGAWHGSCCKTGSRSRADGGFVRCKPRLHSPHDPNRRAGQPLDGRIRVEEGTTRRIAPTNSPLASAPRWPRKAYLR